MLVTTRQSDTKNQGALAVWWDRLCGSVSHQKEGRWSEKSLTPHPHSPTGDSVGYSRISLVKWTPLRRGLPRWLSAKESACNPPANAGDTRDMGLIPGSGWSPEKEMTTHSCGFQAFLPGKFHGQGSLVGYSLWGRKDSGMTSKWTHTHTHTHTHKGQRGP